MAFWEEPESWEQINNLTPEEQEAFKQELNGGIENDELYQQGRGHIKKLLGGGNDAYSAFEGPLMQQFNQQIVPGIAERFAGMGTGAGASSSSGLYNSLGNAATNLSTQLGSLRANLQLQSLQQALQYAQQPRANRMNLIGKGGRENIHRPGQQGWGSTLVQSGITGAANAVGGPVAGALTQASQGVVNHFAGNARQQAVG